jgi:hypothetical protein
VDNQASQHVRVQPGEYVIEHLTQDTEPPSATNWLALIRAPEGLTIVRSATSSDEPAVERWTAFYSGQTAHGLDMPGMLAAVVNPLAQAGLPVFVTSTYHADMVLVPTERAHEAAEVLRLAGHTISGGTDGQVPDHPAP